MAESNIQRVVRALAQQAGVPVSDDELPTVATIYEDLLQTFDTVESVSLDPEEESALLLDLSTWEGAPEGPVAAREGDAF